MAALLLSPQQWRSGALASSRGARLPRYLCTWKCLWIQVRDRMRSATRAAVYYTTSEGAPTLKCESACHRPFFQKPWNNNGLWLERYPWVTLAAFHKVELFTVRWIKEGVAGGASLFHMSGASGEGGASNMLRWGRRTRWEAGKTECAGSGVYLFKTLYRKKIKVLETGGDKGLIFRRGGGPLSLKLQETSLTMS